jgi:hypothetical protein
MVRPQASKIFLISILITHLIISIMTPPASAEHGPRVYIPVFKYGSSTGTQQILGFKNILKTKIFTIIEEIIGIDPKFSYLGTINIDSLEQEIPSSLNELSKYWKESHSLQLFSGNIHSEDGDIIVNSSVYLGNLKGSLRSGFIQIGMKLAPDEFRKQDSHTLITLYALAMDARNLNSSPDVVALYLSKAHTIAQDLDANLPEIRSVKEAIEKVLEELKTGSTK